MYERFALAPLAPPQRSSIDRPSLHRHQEPSWWASCSIEGVSHQGSLKLTCALPSRLPRRGRQDDIGRSVLAAQRQKFCSPAYSAPPPLLWWTSRSRETNAKVPSHLTVARTQRRIAKRPLLKESTLSDSSLSVSFQNGSAASRNPVERIVRGAYGGIESRNICYKQR